jgi:hypothetical protein
MAGVAVVGSGNYELFIDTGFIQDGFILDDATAGVLNNTQYVLDGTTNFAAVLDGCLNVRVKRGRATWATLLALALCRLLKRIQAEFLTRLTV